MGRRGYPAQLMALAESPQVCSPKVPTLARGQVSGRRVPVAAPGSDRQRVRVRGDQREKTTGLPSAATAGVSVTSASAESTRTSSRSSCSPRSSRVVVRRSYTVNTRGIPLRRTMPAISRSSVGCRRRGRTGRGGRHTTPPVASQRAAAPPASASRTDSELPPATDAGATPALARRARTGGRGTRGRGHRRHGDPTQPTVRRRECVSWRCGGAGGGGPVATPAADEPPAVADRGIRVE